MTVVAKTCHSWTAHLPSDQQAAATALAESEATGAQLLGPATAAEV
jgi:hypothetical protein